MQHHITMKATKLIFFFFSVVYYNLVEATTGTHICLLLLPFAIFGKSGFGNFWGTADKLWVSKCIRIKNHHRQCLGSGNEVLYKFDNSPPQARLFRLGGLQSWILCLKPSSYIYVDKYIGRKAQFSIPFLFWAGLMSILYRFI